MHNYWHNLRILLSPGDESGGGGEEGNGEGNLEEGGGEEGDEQEPPAHEPEKKDDKPLSLSEADLVSILSKVIPTGREEATPQREEPQLTPEQIERALNIWKPTSAFLKKLGIAEPTEENLAALSEMRDALIRQANTMSEARFAQILKEQVGDLGDIRQYISDQRATQVVEAFYSKNPDLRQYEEIVEAVSAKLENSGYKANTQLEAFDAISKGAREVLKRMNVKIETPRQENRSSHRMASLSGGSRGGSGGGSGNPKRKEGMSIFDDDGD